MENKAVMANLEVHSWEEAIIRGGEVLLKTDGIEPEYLTRIVEKCVENGPYIVIAPGIAMPHARPEEGAKKLCYGIVTLKDGVKFRDPDNDPIKLLIFMAASDAREHNESAISEIADLCDDENIVEKLIAAKGDEELLEIMGEWN